MKRICMAIAIVMALYANEVDAEETVFFSRYTGNMLIKHLSHHEKVKEGSVGAVEGLEYTHALGYIKGITDYLALLKVAKLEGSDLGIIVPLRFPNGVTLDQLQSIVLKHLKDHPEKLHLAAIALILSALNEAFPVPPV